MMMRRRRGVGLLGVAAVAGTAAYAGRKSAQGAAREQQEQQQIAELQANQAALAQLNNLERSDPAKDDALQRLRIEYEDHIRQVEGADPASAGTPLRRFSSEYERLSHLALDQ